MTPSTYYSSTPPMRTIEEVTALLKPESSNPSLLNNEIKLCWRDPKLVRPGEASSSASKAILSKKNIAALEKALKKRTQHNIVADNCHSNGIIERLSIGWKHGDNRKAVVQLLQVFGNCSKTPALECLDQIELVLLTWVPDSTLKELLVPHASRLKSLHIQATRMKVRTKRQTCKVIKNTYQSVHAVEYLLQEESVARLLAHPPLATQLTSLQSLKFIDCDVLDDDVDILARFLWRHYAVGGIPTLSLRSNRHLTPAALQKIAQAPVRNVLDLSLCNIKTKGALALSRAFHPSNASGWRQKHGILLEELSLCGNYQLDAQAFTALCQVCPYQVRHWNLSYCDMNEHKSLVLLQQLVPSLVMPHLYGRGHGQPCPLTKLTLQGVKMNNPEACKVIQHILRYNRSLTSFQLDDPKYPMYLSAPLLKTIVDGLRYNYGVKELALDLRTERRPVAAITGGRVRSWTPPPTTTTSQCPVQDELYFYLCLNRAGRKLLQQDDHGNRADSKQEWIQTLVRGQSTGRLDVFYWLLRYGVVDLF